MKNEKGTRGSNQYTDAYIPQRPLLINLYIIVKNHKVEQFLFIDIFFFFGDQTD